MKKIIQKLSVSVNKQRILGMTLNFDILMSLIVQDINVWS